MEQSSDESLESEDSELNMTRNETGDKKKISEGSILFLKDENGLAQKREKIQEKVSERGRAKSVGRGITWSTKVSPKKTKRSFSMERSYLKTKRGSMEKSESSEKEEELTFLTKMIDTGTRSKYTFHEKYQFKNIGVVKGILKGTAQDHKCKRKSRSRSRSREKDCQDSRKRWRDERWHHKDQTYVKRREQMCQDQKYHGDQSCAQWKEQSGQSKGHSHFRDQDHGENKKIIPCKYFNDFGFCKYNNGHLDLFGIPKLHICASCYYERGEKRLHCQADCYVVDEACMYFNNFGDCEYKSGHLSLDGKYTRHHICRICFKFGERRYHPAIECKYGDRNYRKNSPVRERHDYKHYEDGHKRQDYKHDDKDGHKRHDYKHDDKGGHKRQDEKPCSFFNNNGSCRFSSGHYPGSGGFTKQLHICSCCLEFLGEDKHHPAANCSLKKKLSGGRMDLVSRGVMELPCNSFNSGNCLLKSGHRLGGETRFLHICKFCFEYRGEQNCHPQDDCKLKKSLLKEAEYESQSKYVYYSRKDTGTINEKDAKHKKPEDKTSRVVEKSAKVSPCKKPTPMEEAINQTMSNLDEAGEHETCLEMKDSNTGARDFNFEKRNLDKTEQEASTESDEGKVDFKSLNLTKTLLKDKEQAISHSSEASVNYQGKINDPPLLQINPLYHNVKSKSNKTRRNLERCTPQTVIISITDTSEIGDNSGEINERGDNNSEMKERSDNSGEMNKKRDNPSEGGLLPVDNVLKMSNVEDSEIELNESEILKKIEQLEKLRTAELEKLRKTRHQTAEAAEVAP